MARYRAPGVAGPDDLLAYYRSIDYSDEERSGAQQWAQGRAPDGRFWYQAVNEALRQHVEHRAPPAVAHLVSLLDEAIERGPLPRPVRAYRGERGLAGLRIDGDWGEWRGRLAADGPPLRTITVPGILATSTDRLVGLSFAMRPGPEPAVLFELDVGEGVPAMFLPAIDSVGRFAHQSELLLPAQSVLEVGDVEVGAGTVVVRCQVL